MRDVRTLPLVIFGIVLAVILAITGAAMLALIFGGMLATTWV